MSKQWRRQKNKKTEIAEEDIRSLVEEIVRNYQPEKIILFGSLASGNARADSDIDLVLVKKTEKPYFDRIEEIVRNCHWKWGLPIELIVYTPEEFEMESRENLFVQQEILAKGKVLYACA